MEHYAASVCWLSTVAIFRHPSILRNLICPLDQLVDLHRLGFSRAAFQVLEPAELECPSWRDPVPEIAG